MSEVIVLKKGDTRPKKELLKAVAIFSVAILVSIGAAAFIHVETVGNWGEEPSAKQIAVVDEIQEYHVTEDIDPTIATLPQLETSVEYLISDPEFADADRYIRSLIDGSEPILVESCEELVAEIMAMELDLPKMQYLNDIEDPINVSWNDINKTMEELFEQINETIENLPLDLVVNFTRTISNIINETARKMGMPLPLSIQEKLYVVAGAIALGVVIIVVTALALAVPPVAPVLLVEIALLTSIILCTGIVLVFLIWEEMGEDIVEIEMQILDAIPGDETIPPMLEEAVDVLNTYILRGVAGDNLLSTLYILEGGISYDEVHRALNTVGIGMSMVIRGLAVVFFIVAFPALSAVAAVVGIICVYLMMLVMIMMF